MSSSSNNASTDGVLQDANSEPNDEEQVELCPGFKDVDTFVKVSDASELNAAAGNVEERSCRHNTKLPEL